MYQIPSSSGVLEIGGGIERTFPSERRVVDLYARSRQDPYSLPLGRRVGDTHLDRNYNI